MDREDQWRPLDGQSLSPNEPGRKYNGPQWSNGERLEEVREERRDRVHVDEQDLERARERYNELLRDPRGPVPVWYAQTPEVWWNLSDEEKEKQIKGRDFAKDNLPQILLCCSMVGPLLIISVIAFLIIF